ncbi:glucan biosynthesis protein G [Caldimonas sp. KR1-144]|uniref:glucan biosynthesis protein G n=1 Tax=Caldimonas sp. KR1-144 TaxID=3400911 RepID=UPI003C00526E
MLALFGIGRRALWAAAPMALLWPHGSAHAAFDLETLASRARALAAAPWRAPPPAIDARAAALSYDEYRDIRFRTEASWWRDAGLPYELQFFSVGRRFTHAVRLQEIVDGQERPLVLPPSAFNYGRAAPAFAAATTAQAAGFRIHTALNRKDYKDEVIVFLGASYFRAVGSGQHYGLSARALAVDTAGGAGPEEFPSFTAFWLERPAKDARSLTLYALLEGPRVTGAYRFELRPGTTTEVDVQARVFLRVGAQPPVTTLGIAPLTTMFLGGENQPHRLEGDPDFRPEVHDSDGLQIESADGEWLWRPLINPRHAFVTSFQMPRGVRGFGLMQRDRRFTSYEDPEARYDQRPSVWIVPRGDWGAGRVELLQFDTPDETNDNIAAYWVPAVYPKPGEPLAFAYTMRWQGDDLQRPPGAWVEQSRVGRSYEQPAPGEVQFNIDFAGPALAGEAPPEPVVNPGDNARVRVATVHPLPGEPTRWRLTLKIQRLDASKPTELRAFLRRGPDTLSETWTYAMPPR